MSSDSPAPGPWSLLPVALLRQAGFPLALLDPIAGPACFPLAQDVLDRQVRARAAGDRLKRALKAAAVPDREAAANPIGMLRPLPAPAALGLTTALGSQGAMVEEYQTLSTGLRDAMERFRSALTADLDQGRSAVAGAFRDARLQDALLLSNDAAAPQFLEWLGDYRGENDGRARRMTDMLAMYLQRLATKNETHSHFGPVNVARVDPAARAFGWTEAKEPRRRAYLSHWAADRIAQAFGEAGSGAGAGSGLDPAAERGRRALIRPRRHPLVFVRPGEVDVYGCGADAAPGVDWRFTAGGRHAVDADEEWLLRNADGERTLAELARRWASETASGRRGQDPAAVVERLVARGWLSARIEVPSGEPRPLDLLCEQLAGLPGGPDAPVADLARQVEAFATTEFPARAAALTALKESFEEITSASANRRSGSHYADRSIFWEEAHGRLDDLRMGPDLAALLSTELAFAYEIALAAPRLRFGRERAILADWFRDRFGNDGRLVPLADYYRAFTEDRDRLTTACRAVDAELADLDATVERLLIGTPEPGCREVVVPAQRMAELRSLLPVEPAAFCNPDVLLAAESPQALADGRFLAVIGECHAGRELLTHSSMSIQVGERAPDVVAEVHAHYQGLLGPDEYLADVIRGHSDKTASQLRFPGADLEVYGRSPKPRSDVLDPSDLHVGLSEGRLELTAAGRPGRLRLLAPPAGGYSAADDPLAPFAFPRLHGGNGLRLSHLAHVPRIRYGRTVIQRETWRIATAELRGWSPVGAPPKNDDAAEFLAASRLRAAHGWPRRVFAKVSGEPKPVFVDWDAPLLVRQFFRLVRRAEGQVVISEMLPDADQNWLHLDGGAHTSELRYAVFSAAPNRAE